MVIESLCSPLDSEAPEGAGVGSHIVQQVLALLDDVELVLTRSRAGIQVQLAPGERLALRAGDQSASITVRFDPQNRTQERGTRIDFVGSKTMERPTWFLATLKRFVSE